MGRFLTALWAPFRWAGSAGKRAITSLPWGSGGPASTAVSSERALSLIPLFACVRILADSVASLPIQLYRRNGAAREMVSYIPQLFFAPAAVDNLFMWLHKCVVSMAMRGNAYGLITQRDNLGFPTMIEWLNPDDVWVDELYPVRPVYYWQGRMVPTADIIHIPWVVLPGKVVGLSPIGAFAESIGHGLKTVEYGRSWFENGGTPPATMKNIAKAINPDEAEEISDRLAARVRARKPLVFGSDWDFTALKVSPEESQFVETMRLNATQIATIYGVPPSKVGGDSGGSMTYSTVELEGLDLAQFTLRPWLVRLESVFSKLMPGQEFVKFNVDSMLRTSLIDRYTAHGMALAQGWQNRDGIRAIEDLSPLPNGEGQTYFALPAAPTPPPGGTK